MLSLFVTNGIYICQHYENNSVYMQAIDSEIVKRFRILTCTPADKHHAYGECADGGVVIPKGEFRILLNNKSYVLRWDGVQLTEVLSGKTWAAFSKELALREDNWCEA